MLFCFDKNSKKKSKKILNSIENKLSSLDSETALEYLNWIDKKTSYLQKTNEKEGYFSLPSKIKRGDIVWVEFGINVGTELSDHKTNGHYALIWAIDLGNVIVIPLSSRDALGSNLTIDIGEIEELNEKNSHTHTYLKLDAIRSISKRRIAKIVGVENGKITLSNEQINLIKKEIERAFL